MQSYYVDENMNTNKLQISSDFISLPGYMQRSFLVQKGTSILDHLALFSHLHSFTGTIGIFFFMLNCLKILINSVNFNQKYYTCVPAPKCGRRPHFGAVGIAGLYIGRLRNCLPFLTSFTQCRMANLHIKCFDINVYH